MQYLVEVKRCLTIEADTPEQAAERAEILVQEVDPLMTVSRVKPLRRKAKYLYGTKTAQ
jgi:hypothetical protein